MRSSSTQSRGMWNAPESSFRPTFILRRSSRLSKPRLRIDLDVLQVEALELHLFLEALVEVLDDLLAHRLVARLREEAHLAERLDEPIGVAADDALEKLGDALAHLRRELRDGAEIEQDERAVLADQDVPGVRIGVVERRRRRSSGSRRAPGGSPDPSCRPPSPRVPARSPTFIPSTNVVVSTRFVDTSRTGTGKRTRGSFSKFFAIARCCSPRARSRAPGGGAL